MRVNLEQKKYFVSALLRWYHRHGRDLPWRYTSDPYMIFVSEIMLQQTQVDRVKIKYQEFLRKFPTLQSLAQSRVSDVIRAWQGMGYNRRALNLQRACRDVLSKFKGIFPSDRPLLKSLSGIGEYTARAVSVFAFRKPVIALDVNIRRVLDRSFFGGETRKQKSTTTEKQKIEELTNLGDSIVTPKIAYDLNQGLMDIGATICTAKTPQCEVCPLKKACKAYPAILSLSWASIKKKRRLEPAYAGIPRRLWRGKVVEYLREMPHSVTSGEIISWLAKRFHPCSQQWLTEVLTALERDNLVRKHKGTNAESYRLR